MTGSYVEIFLDVKARLGLDVRDCSFDNFKDIDGVCYETVR